jgi:hypothetical protein
MIERRRFRQNNSFLNRLTAWADKLGEEAEKLEAGPEKDALLNKITQAYNAAEVDRWANSTEAAKEVNLTSVQFDRTGINNPFPSSERKSRRSTAHADGTVVISIQLPSAQSALASPVATRMSVKRACNRFHRPGKNCIVSEAVKVNDRE